MKIKRVLNNNVVVSLDEKGQEIIVMAVVLPFKRNLMISLISLKLRKFLY